MKRDSLLACFGLVPKRNGRTTCVKAAPRREALIAAIFMFMLVVRCGRAHAETCGDADGNDQVTVTDGVNVLRAAAGLPGNCPLARCDIDGNGAISVTDGVNVLRIAADLSVNPSCLSDPFISHVDNGEIFGELTKIPLVSPPGAPDTIAIRSPAEAQPGSTIGFVVTYQTGTTAAQAAGASTNLFVASRSAESSSSSKASFVLPLEGTQGEVTILVAIRSDTAVEQFRIDFATGSDTRVTGQRYSILIFIFHDQPPLCGNNDDQDPGEECDPPGSRCGVGGFCDTVCKCETSGSVCGNNQREGSEECDGTDDANCEDPLGCRSDDSCRCETPRCGNGVREGSEECDGQQAAQCGGGPCRSDCTCAPAQVVTFVCTAGPQVWTVPSGVTSISVYALGAYGGGPFSPVPGGPGGCVSASLPVTVNQTLNVFVGCMGDLVAPGMPGFNGGGSGGNGTNGGFGGGGGGASDIRIGGTSLSDRVLVAAGGGGAGVDSPGGGAGGGVTGVSGGGGNGGGGGTQTSGGAAGVGLSCQGNAGTLETGGDGGAGCNGATGGGGGGFYGGGGAASSGNGGGGSSLVPPGGFTAGPIFCEPLGNGEIVISYGPAAG